MRKRFDVVTSIRGPALAFDASREPKPPHTVHATASHGDCYDARCGMRVSPDVIGHGIATNWMIVNCDECWRSRAAERLREWREIGWIAGWVGDQEAPPPEAVDTMARALQAESPDAERIWRHHLGRVRAGLSRTYDVSASVAAVMAMNKARAQEA